MPSAEQPVHREEGDPYLEQLREEGLLSSREAAILTTAGVDSPATLWSALLAFPSLGTIEGFDLPGLSSRLALALGSATAELANAPGSPGQPQPKFTFGAMYPHGAPAPHGWSVTVPASEATAAALAIAPAPIAEAALDCRCTDWPVRDQGDRGTCVAFAATACREQLECPLGPRDLSEQYLYWAIKDRITDPWPGADGTLLDYAHQALGQEGLCEEPLWPYNPIPVVGNPGQGGPGTPSAAAQADAAGNRVVPGRYRCGTPAGNAAELLRWLVEAERPVAISVPVFHDRLAAQSNNWVSPVGWLYGRVLDPPATSVANGGHAVCVTGFVPGSTEAFGGYFILRNSWGTTWGQSLPHPSYAAPGPGYGQISASYVERYLWEMLQL